MSLSQRPTGAPPVLCLFGDDLRLADHPALAAAVASGRSVIPVYVLDDQGDPTAAHGSAARWWLHHSIAALESALGAAGSRLILRRGPLPATLCALATETGADAIHLLRRYEPGAAAQETALGHALGAAGTALHRYGGRLLFEPETVRTAAGAPFKVFTPFSRACLALPPPAPPLPAPTRIAPPRSWPASERLTDWGLCPAAPDWSGGLAEAWQPGAAAGEAKAADFLACAADYGRARDRPDRAATSRLSPHLRFGEISPRALWHAARFAAARAPAAAPGIEAFLRQLLWREFCHHLLFHFPDLARAPFRHEFAAFPWARDDRALALWQRGRTGYPIVDAGMRELWRTGWMHNRVRMIAASFLVKDLMVPWQDGAAWFADTLVDADLANNAAGWQWVAGSGADAAPYFRIFNPVLQGRKFDPEGTYVRRWLPEIAALPDRFIHAPWEAPPDVLAAAGVRLADSYPAPIVDHGTARERALAAFRQVTGKA